MGLFIYMLLIMAYINRTGVPNAVFDIHLHSLSYVRPTVGEISKQNLTKNGIGFQDSFLLKKQDSPNELSRKL